MPLYMPGSSRIRALYSGLINWWRNRSQTPQQRMDRLLYPGTPPAAPPAPAAQDRRRDDRPQLNLKTAFDNAVRLVGDGTIRLGMMESVRFKIASGLAGIFNMLNFGGVTESLVQHFQQAAVETVREHGRRDIPFVPFM